MNNEAFDRNFVLETIHNTKLPSISVWDVDSIYDYSPHANLQWWVDINKVYLNKKKKNSDIQKIIYEWRNYYERATEYCSKRFGNYLDCDI